MIRRIFVSLEQVEIGDQTVVEVRKCVEDIAFE